MNNEVYLSFKNLGIRYNVNEIEKGDAKKYLNSLEKKFIKDPKKLLWWCSLKNEGTIINYEDRNAFDLLQDFVDNEQKYFLAITDEEYGPWNIFYGKVSDFIEVIKEQSFFEYFIFDTDLTGIIFDTHHNEFVFTGDSINNFRITNA